MLVGDKHGTLLGRENNAKLRAKVVCCSGKGFSAVNINNAANHRTIS
jgi:hypothetical protein